VVSQASLHDVEAVVVAGLDVRVPLAGRAAVHLLDGRQTLFARRNLRKKEIEIIWMKFSY
jgi:hypothetical protein